MTTTPDANTLNTNPLDIHITPPVLQALDLLRAGKTGDIAGLIRGAIDTFFHDTAYDQGALRLFIRHLALTLVATDLYPLDITFELFGMLVTNDPNDLDVVRGYAATAWLHGQHDPADSRAVEAARRYVRLAPETPDAHRLLGSAALSHGLFLESYLAYSAAAHFAGYDIYGMSRQLAKLLMQGTRVVRFNSQGVEYAFELATFSTQAIEAATHHACARLTEADELALACSFVGNGASIVEVGALVGNHTVFFLKNLAPRSIRVFEANPKSVPVVERNIALNLPAASRPVTQVTNAFVGGHGQTTVDFAGVTVPYINLSQAGIDRVDFIKIDVDGAELTVLDGAEALLATHRPKIMLEVNGVTRRIAGEWLAARGYRIDREIEQSGYSNLFLSPVSSGPTSSRLILR